MGTWPAGAGEHMMERKQQSLMQTMRAKTRALFTRVPTSIIRATELWRDPPRGLRDGPWAQCSCASRVYWQEAISNGN